MPNTRQSLRSAGSLPEGIVPSGNPERDDISLYGTPKEEIGPNAHATHYQGKTVFTEGFTVQIQIQHKSNHSLNFNRKWLSQMPIKEKRLGLHCS